MNLFMFCLFAVLTTEKLEELDIRMCFSFSFFLIFFTRNTGATKKRRRSRMTYTILKPLHSWFELFQKFSNIFGNIEKLVENFWFLAQFRANKTSEKASKRKWDSFLLQKF